MPESKKDWGENKKIWWWKNAKIDGGRKKNRRDEKKESIGIAIKKEKRARARGEDKNGERARK